MDETDLHLVATVIPHGLNIHHLPAGKIFDAVPRGTRVTIVRFEQRPQFLWAYVEIPSRHEFGWCRADYLAIEALPEVEPEPEVEVEPHASPWDYVVIALGLSAALALLYGCVAL